MDSFYVLRCLHQSPKTVPKMQTCVNIHHQIHVGSLYSNTRPLPSCLLQWTYDDLSCCRSKHSGHYSEDLQGPDSRRQELPPFCLLSCSTTNLLESIFCRELTIYIGSVRIWNAQLASFQYFSQVCRSKVINHVLFVLHFHLSHRCLWKASCITDQLLCHWGAPLYSSNFMYNFRGISLPSCGQVISEWTTVNSELIHDKAARAPTAKNSFCWSSRSTTASPGPLEREIRRNGTTGYMRDENSWISTSPSDMHFRRPPHLPFSAI